MQSWLTRNWYRKTLCSFLLYPFSLLYRFIIFLRRCCYRFGLFKTHRFSVPIIVVGNITVGGTGKTPYIIALTQQLIQQGKRPGIVSRGYGGRSKTWPQQVTPHSDPEKVGDEPVLIAQKTLCPVVVSPNRPQAVEALLAQHDCDVVLSDDGLQHYALARDVEIVLLDKERQCGNAFCLPAGPLREPKSRLKQVDCVVEKGGEDYQLQLGEIYQLNNPENKLIPNGQAIHALCGIAHPQPFFQSLRDLGFDVTEMAFPDHHRFSSQDFPSHKLLVITEKDAVKCRQFSTDRVYVLPLVAVIKHHHF